MRIIVEQVNLPVTSNPCVLLDPADLPSSAIPLSNVLIEDEDNLLSKSSIVDNTSDKMWSSAGLGPPTYRPFEFPTYDDYRGGMQEFAGGASGLSAVGPGTSWVTAGTSPPAAPQTPVTSPNDDSVRLLFLKIFREL